MAGRLATAETAGVTPTKKDHPETTLVRTRNRTHVATGRRVDKRHHGDSLAVPIALGHLRRRPRRHSVPGEARREWQRGSSRRGRPQPGEGGGRCVRGVSPAGTFRWVDCADSVAISNPGNKKIADAGWRWHGVRVSTKRESPPWDPSTHPVNAPRPSLHETLVDELCECEPSTENRTLLYLMKCEANRQEQEAAR